MPHAEKDIMGEPMTNGEKPSSRVLSHVTSYPVVSDGISAYKSNPYGQRSLVVATKAYDQFAKPVIPYFARPFSYVAPYITKADSLADQGLTKVDTKFPIVKEDTQKLKETVKGFANLPFQLAGQGKEYIFSTYHDERKKVGGEGVVADVKAFISFDLRLAADSYKFIMAYLNKGKETASKKMDEAKN
jgi:hypothetical protein